jgi:hypothetical protein
VEWEAGRIGVAVLTKGSVSDGEVDYAVGRVAAALRKIDEPVLFARLKLGRAGDPARPKPALAEVALDLDGELVRAHVAAGDLREAADLLQRRLRDRLQHRAEHRGDLRTRGAQREPGEWRHGDLPTVRPARFDRPVDQREVVRHKTFAIDELTPDEAAFDMDQLDYDFYLFCDLASGQDAVLERLPDATYRLTRLRPSTAEHGPVSIPLAVADTAAPALTVDEARERFDVSGEPFLFFADASTGRGNVIYRRYDGHYGLITPASEGGST